LDEAVLIFFVAGSVMIYVVAFALELFLTASP